MTLARDEEHFVDVIDDLRQVLSFNVSRYDAARTALLLRQLVLDEVCLLDTVASAHGQKIALKVSENVVGFEGRFMAGPWLDGDLAELLQRERIRTAKVRREVLPDGFAEQRWWKYVDVPTLLGSAVVIRDEEKATVRDLIRFYANNYGGAHWDPGDRAGQVPVFLADLPGQAEVHLRQSMSAVGRIVFRAAEALAFRISLRAAGVHEVPIWTE